MASPECFWLAELNTEWAERRNPEIARDHSGNVLIRYDRSTTRHSRARSGTAATGHSLSFSVAPMSVNSTPPLALSSFGDSTMVIVTALGIDFVVLHHGVGEILDQRALLLDRATTERIEHDLRHHSPPLIDGRHASAWRRNLHAFSDRCHATPANRMGVHIFCCDGGGRFWHILPPHCGAARAHTPRSNSNREVCK